MTMLVKFHRKLSWAIIDNQWVSSDTRIDQEEEVTIWNEYARCKGNSFSHTKGYCNRWWVCNSVSKYRQYVYRMDKCKNQVRTSM